MSPTDGRPRGRDAYAGANTLLPGCCLLTRMSPGETFGIDDALALSTYGAPSWNDDGTRVGYQQFSGGETDFLTRSVPPFEETDLSLSAPGGEATRLESDVSEHDWRPGHPMEVAVVREGDVVRFDAATGDRETLAASDAGHSSPSWHPDGDVLAYVREGSLWLHDVTTGSVRELAGDVAELFGPTPVEWSADGRFVATLTGGGDGPLALTVYEPERAPDAEADNEPPVAWERAPGPETETVVDTFAWAGEYLVYAADDRSGTARTYHAVRPSSASPPEVGAALLSERDDRGLPGATLTGTDAGRVAVVAAPTGHYHLSVVDVSARIDAVAGESAPGFEGAGVTQVTAGAFEARGDAVGAPAWDEAGERVAYVTNEHDIGERRLHVAAVGEDAVTETVSFEGVDGNAVYPSWAGDRVACLRAGRTDPADVHVFDVSTGAARRVSVSHPRPEAFARFPDPEPVTFESSADGESVHGYLYAPSDAAPGDDRPAVVWAHGGPVRQMRRGFHHMQSYAYFHAFNQVLVDRGYVVLELNYRGGIGYGRDYEMGIHHAIGETDVSDCVDAAAFLRAHDAVGDRVGFWGLSYGGFLANAVATKTDSLDCAVNFAGIWDWRDWVRYATSLHWGARRFVPLFGGHPDDPDPAVEERYRVGSPCDHAEGLDTPLFALHGTDDPNVPFAQMDALVSDLVDRGDDFELAYYPEEDHMFQQPATWRDTMRRVLPFLDEHLRA